MRVIALIENRVSKRGLIAEHGLCYYIETENAQILFDTGASNNYALNAQQLGIDISKIDYLILKRLCLPILEKKTRAVIQARPAQRQS